MQGGTSAAGTALLLLSACNQAAEQQPSSNIAQPANIVEKQEPLPVPPTATDPDARAPLAEPRGAIEPKSLEAAGQVVQHYGALIEQGRYREAEKLWGNGDAARAFTRKLDPQTHLEIGELGETEGAAGSIYTTLPVVFYGKAYRRAANVILRRVNDVPGSTQEQRRWHIERIEWKSPA